MATAIDSEAPSVEAEEQAFEGLRDMLMDWNVSEAEISDVCEKFRLPGTAVVPCTGQEKIDGGEPRPVRLLVSHPFLEMFHVVKASDEAEQKQAA